MSKGLVGNTVMSSFPANAKDRLETAFFFLLVWGNAKLNQLEFTNNLQ